MIERCPFCGREVDRAAAGSVQVSVVRSDALPLGTAPLDSAVFLAHTACVANAMRPGRAGPLDAWPR